MEIDFRKNVEKVNQIELDQEFAYIFCSVKESDRKPGKVSKLGRSLSNTHMKMLM